MPIKNTVNDIIGCAYFVVTGDAHLAEEETLGLYQLRRMIQNMVAAEPGVEHFAETGDLEAALRLCPGLDSETQEAMEMECQIVNQEYGMMGAMMSAAALPTFLQSLSEARGDVTSLEEVIALGKSQAKTLENPYHQKLATHVCVLTAYADGDFNVGERSAAQVLCEEWGLDLNETMSWCLENLSPIWNAYEECLSDSELLAEDEEDSDWEDESSDDDDQVFPIKGDENSFVAFVTSMITIVLVQNDMASDYDEIIAKVIESKMGLFGIEAEDPMAIASQQVASIRSILEDYSADDLRSESVDLVRSFAEEISDDGLRTSLIMQSSALTNSDIDEGEFVTLSATEGDDAFWLAKEALDVWGSSMTFSV